MTATASRTARSGVRVTGSTIMPDSERLTLSTSPTWSSIERLRWMTPMPPARARAIAIRPSVTVSIAADMIGTRSTISPAIRVAVSTSAGRIDEAAGSSRTSSKVSPRPANLSCRIARPARSRSPIENVPLAPRLVGAETVSVMESISWVKGGDEAAASGVCIALGPALRPAHAGQQLVGQMLVGDCAPGFGVVLRDDLPVARGLGQPNRARHDRAQQVVRHVAPDLLDHVG